jgi:hypothetical protein
LYAIGMSVLFERRETAPVLRVFGDQAVRIGALVGARPSLLRRLAFAPPRAIHCVGAYLHLAAEADGPDEVVAEKLEESDPRDLLRAAIPDAPPRLYRALDRAGDFVRKKSYYERLGTLCTGPLADMLLTAGPLNDARLNWAESVLGLDPAILSMPAILRRSQHQVEAINTLITFLRAQGVFEDHDLQLSKKAGLRAVMTRIQDILDRVPAPPAPFALPPPYHIVGSIGELRKAGAALGNCVGHVRGGGIDHWFRVTRGVTVYVACDDPKALATIRRVGAGLFTIEEYCGQQNADVGPDARKLLADALNAAGVRLIQDPAHALMVLAHFDRRAPNAEDDDDDDGDPGDPGNNDPDDDDAVNAALAA